MTYLTLLLAGLLPPIALLTAWARTRNAAPGIPDLHQLGALTLLLALAATTTLPWDAALIARDAWSYPRGRPVGWIAGVPVEELLFMLLQSVLVGLWLRGRSSSPSAACAGLAAARVRTAGTALLLCLAGTGLVLAGRPEGTYLGWLLAWAGSLLALQWAVAGDVLWARRSQLAGAVLPPAVYLCALDRLALHLRLWELSPARTSGLDVLGLPLEEAAFFLLTSTLAATGLTLATHRPALRRVTALGACLAATGAWRRQPEPASALRRQTPGPVDGNLHTARHGHEAAPCDHLV